MKWFQKFKDIEAKATKGEWRWNPWQQDIRSHNVLGTDSHPVLRVTKECEVYIPNKYDALFIASFRNVAPRMIRIVEAAEKLAKEERHEVLDTFTGGDVMSISPSDYKEFLDVVRGEET